MSTDKRDASVSKKVHWRPFTAASLLMLTAALLLLDDLWQPTTTSVVAVPCAADFWNFDEQADLQETFEYSSHDELLSNKEYFRQASSFQEARLEQALAAAYGPAVTNHFNLVLHPDTDSFALVLIVDSQGRVIGTRNRYFEVAYPVGKSWTPSSGRLAAGQLAVLPHRNLTWDSEHEQAATYDAGFSVPEGSKRLTIFTGLRERELDNELKKSLDALLLELSRGTPSSDNTSSQLRRWLREKGFSVTATNAPVSHG